MTPDPFSTMEIRKTLVVEALRSQGDLTKKQLLHYLGWEAKVLECNPPILTLLVHEGRVERIRVGNRITYRADPDLTTQLLTPQEDT